MAGKRAGYTSPGDLSQNLGTHIKVQERCNYTRCPSACRKSSMTHTNPFPVLAQTHTHTHTNKYMNIIHIYTFILIHDNSKQHRTLNVPIFSETSTHSKENLALLDLR